ncbi:hypothetical protein FFF34_000940 [Inquilinus sp. KBS0705]|nr:hypothetical protein FFF34_000940 [Inquilinus sp. KBS0705]
MEQLIINIPESKSAEIRKFLKTMGVLIDSPNRFNLEAYKAKIAKISTWSEDELKALEEGRKAIDNIKPQEW